MLLRMHGFDYYNTAHALLDWNLFQDCVVTAGIGRNGTPGMGASTSAYTRVRAARSVTPSPVNELTVGWWLDLGAGLPGGGFARFMFGSIHGVGPFSFSTQQVSLLCDPTGHAYVTRGDHIGTTIVGPTSGVVLSSGNYFIEFRAVIHPSAGEIEVRINNVVVLYGTGLNTRDLATNTIGGYEVVAHTALDDVYVLDPSGSDNNYFLGKGFHVETRFTTDPGDLSQWTPSAGANWQCVDDASPDDGATQVSAAFAALVDLYDLTTLVSDLQAFGVQVNVIARKASSAILNQIAVGSRIDGVDYYLPTHTLSNAFALYQAIWERAPDDLALWTTAKINAAQGALRRVA